MQTISRIVVHQINAKKISGFTEAKRIWQNPLNYGFLLLLFGLAIVAVGNKVLGERLIADLGTIMAFAGVAFFVIKSFLLLSSSRGVHSKEHDRKVDTTTELPPLLEPKDQPSVTEFITRNFDPVYAERYESKTPSVNGRSDS